MCHNQSLIIVLLRAQVGQGWTPPSAGQKGIDVPTLSLLRKLITLNQKLR
jgi:hypothetical protein